MKNSIGFVYLSLQLFFFFFVLLGVCNVTGFMWIFAIFWIIKTNSARGISYHIIHLNYIYVRYLLNKVTYVQRERAYNQIQYVRDNKMPCFGFSRPIGRNIFHLQAIRNEAKRQKKSDAWEVLCTMIFSFLFHRISLYTGHERNI